MSSQRTRQRTTETEAEISGTSSSNSARMEQRRQATSTRMAEVVPFQFHTKEVRTVERDGQVWFIAKDVCLILEIANSRDVLRGLDDDERSHVTIQTGGRNRRMGVVNESGVFAIVLKSDKPEACAFRRWVTSDVLPSIRKTGAYGKSAEDPAIEHSDIADIINRRTGMYIVIVDGELRTMQETNGAEIVAIATEALSSMMAASLIAAQSALTLMQTETLLPGLDTRFASETLEKAIGHGAELARRYVTIIHDRAAACENEPVGLSH